MNLNGSISHSLLDELNAGADRLFTCSVSGVATDFDIYGEHRCDTEAIQCEYTCAIVWLSSC